MYGSEEISAVFEGLPLDHTVPSFSPDEKIFTTEQAFNSHNDGIWAAESPSNSRLVERKTETQISHGLGGHHKLLTVIVKIVGNFPKRLRDCVEANGGHFETCTRIFCIIK